MMFDIEQYRTIITLLESMDQKWAFYILFTLFVNHAMGFNDLKRKVKPVTSKTLSQRLKQLQGTGLIRKETVVNIPKRVEYRLTIEGEKMISFFVDLFGSKAKG